MIKDVFKDWKVILVLFLLVISLIYGIRYNPDVSGVAIRSVGLNSSAEDAGIENPNPTIRPRSREVITMVNSQAVSDEESYFDAIETIIPGTTFQVRTNKQTYKLAAIPTYKTIILPELENKTIQKTIIVNETINGSITEVEKIIEETILVNKTEKEIIGLEDIGLSIYDAPLTDIRMGLDIQGGTRVLLQPESDITNDEMDLLLTNMKQRLNVYGLSDVVVRQANDLSGNTYILVEIAGANEEEVTDLLSKQGKFEAKIGNDTVFIGGEKDITYVCTSAECSGIDPMSGCGQLQDGTYSCRFRFSISLKPEAGQRQGSITSKLQTIDMDENGNPLPEGRQYLEKGLDLYLDDVLVDSLNIGSDLKGSETTDIQVAGGGVGQTEQQAVFDALANMKKLQTYLNTGSLPVKINIVKTDSISPTLGEEFVNNALLIGFVALLSVAITVSIRYRKAKIALPMILFSVSEIVILLGIAGIIGWNIDLAAIAGIIIVVGTSVDHQIVISDEILKKGKITYQQTMKKKIKNALYIIFGAFFTTTVAMIPLISAGAGLLKGFAITTMLGLFVGVFVARPAFARTLEILMKD